MRYSSSNTLVYRVSSRHQHVLSLRGFALFAVLFALFVDQTAVAREEKREIEFLIQTAFNVKTPTSLTTTLKIQNNSSEIPRLHTFTIKIRDIDAPRNFQPCQNQKIYLSECGRISYGGLINTVLRRRVKCTYTYPEDVILSTENTSTIVADCFIADGEVNISHELISGGVAIYRGDDPRLIQMQAEAKRDKRGIWSYDFMDPEIWSQGRTSK